MPPQPDNRLGRLARLALNAATSPALGVGLLMAGAIYLALATLPEAFTRALWGSRFLSAEWLAERLGTTPAGLYAHPVLLTLAAAMSAVMIAATVRRVPFRLAFGGTWLAHAGVLVLLVGGTGYALGHREAVATTRRTGLGWRPIGQVALADRLALYVRGPGGQTSVSPPGASVRPARPGRPVDPPAGRVELPGGDLAFVPTGRVGAFSLVELEISDRAGQRHAVLAPALPGLEELSGEDYAVFYKPGMTPEQLAAWTDRVERQPSPYSFDVAYLVTLTTGQAMLYIRRPEAGGELHPLAEGEPTAARLGGQLVALLPLSFRAGAAVEMTLSAEPWRDTVFVPQYARRQDRGGVRIVGPADGVYRLQLAPPLQPLGGRIRILSAELQTYAGSVVPRDYVTEVEIETPAGVRREKIRLNRPVHVGPWQISHGRWSPAGGPPREMVFQAHTRPGLPLVWAGCGMIVLALPWAFYLKPVMMRRKGRR